MILTSYPLIFSRIDGICLAGNPLGFATNVEPPADIIRFTPTSGSTTQRMADTCRTKSARDLGLEVVESDALNVEAREAIAAAHEIGRELEHMGAFIQEALREVFDCRTFEALEGKALRLRSLANQAHSQASDLTRKAGILEGLGLVRRAAESLNPTEG